MRKKYFYQSHSKCFTKDELSFCNTKIILDIIQRYRIGIKLGSDYFFKNFLKILPNFTKVSLWVLTKKIDSNNENLLSSENANNQFFPATQ